MTKRFAIKDTNLLEIAKNVFGEDIVIDAWVISDESSTDEGYIKDFILPDLRNNKFNFIIERIGIGCITIALKLSNGNIITATSSEWGNISKNEYDFVEVE